MEWAHDGVADEALNAVVPTREIAAPSVVGSSACTKRLSKWFPASSFAKYNRQQV